MLIRLGPKLHSTLETGTASDQSKFALNRFAEPHEISGIVSFLCDSERASYITGENYVIAGGANSRL